MTRFATLSNMRAKNAFASPARNQGLRVTVVNSAASYHVPSPVPESRRDRVEDAAARPLPFRRAARAPALSGAGPSRARARPRRAGRGPASGERPLRDQYVELSGLGRHRLLEARERDGARARRAGRVRAAPAAHDRGHRPQLLRSDPARGPRAIRRAAPRRVSVLREGARGRDVGGAARALEGGAEGREPRLPESAAVPGRNARALRRGLPRAHRAVRLPVPSGARVARAAAARVRREARPIPGSAAPGFPLRGGAAGRSAPDGRVSRRARPPRRGARSELRHGDADAGSSRRRRFPSRPRRSP